jgi:protein-tyrosine phosphatase
MCRWSVDIVMLDLHCHILPGIDDGPETLDEALALARFCEADGITHVVATPHCHQYLRTHRSRILPEVAAFNEELRHAGVRLVVLPGSEIQLTSPHGYKRDFEAGLLCHLGDGPDYTLVEFPWDNRHYPADAEKVVDWLRCRGMTAILAHPERQVYFRDVPGRLQALVDAGVIIQLTVDSLLGNFGPIARAEADRLLRLYPDVVLATDSHNTSGRCSGLTAGYELVRRRYGSARADDLRSRSDGILAQLLAQDKAMSRQADAS